MNISSHHQILEHHSYEEILRNLVLFSLEKKMAKGLHNNGL